MRFWSERPAPLEGLALVVERRGTKFVVELGVSSFGCFIASEIICRDLDTGFTSLMRFRVPLALGLEL